MKKLISIIKQIRRWTLTSLVNKSVEGRLKKIFLTTLFVLLLLTSFFSSITQETAAIVKTDSALNDKGLSIVTNDTSKGTVLAEGDNTQIPDNLEKASVNEHKITPLELIALESKIGVYLEGQNYSQIIDGHGTGLRPPTEQEWTEIATRLSSVGSVSPQLSLPSSVDQSTKPWFPPIGNQGSQGSCVAWSVGYYVKTFQEAQEHGWSVSNASWQTGSPGYPTQAYQSKIMSPAFIYNLQNGGYDNGLTISGAINLICSIGACSWEKMPYMQSDYTTWPSEDAWSEAPLYRSQSGSYQYMDLTSDQGIANLKSWLASGHLASIGVDGNKFSMLTTADVWTVNNYVNPSENHANTIVGYDDNIVYTENGVLRYGAFKVANSWGVGGWEHVPDGFYWISYAAMKQPVGYCLVYNDVIGYKPQLAATVSITHAKRGECSIEVGLGDPNAPIITKDFTEFDCIAGGSFPFCQNDILLDITEFKNYAPNVYNQSFFLRVYDGGTSTTGTINRFSIEYAQSTNAPCQTVNGNAICLTVTLPSLLTTWTNTSLVNSDQDSVDHKTVTATDSNGNMYVAYADLFSDAGKTAIYIRKSTDDGQTWPIIICGYFSSYNLANPSMAINPYNNEIYVASELEVSASDHDILVLRYVNSSWSWSSVSSFSGQDDRYPSITSEYQYGATNRQYISYEYVYNNDDRDLMFAKTTDKGSTWTITKLRGNWPDSNAHSQTSITNAEGNIYIAYRFGTDYNSVSEIRVDRSSDFGATWTQFTYVDGLPNDCKFPCIIANHTADIVMVAFQYQWSINDKDIWYSYSTNNGTTWIKQQTLFTSTQLDEKAVVLTADITGSIYAICKAGRYAEFKATPNLQPANWTALKIINDGWVGDGLAVGVRCINNIYYPYSIWTDSTSKNVYFCDSARTTLTACSLSSSCITYGQSVNITGVVNTQVSDGTMNIQYSTNNLTWNNISSGIIYLGSFMFNWTPPNPGVFYTRSSWSGDANYKGSTSTSQQLIVNATCTITTDPVGLQIIVDDTNYITPQIFNWSIGSIHSIDISSIQNGPINTRYVFTNWNDSGAQSHSITVDITGKTITANFKTQYNVTFCQSGINADFASNVFSVNDTSYDRSGFSNWFDAGNTFTFSYSSLLVVSQNTKQYVLVGTNSTSPLTISGPVTVLGNYKPQYYLTINSPYGNPTGQGWFDAGSSANFDVTPIVLGDAGTRYALISWSGTGTGSYTGSSNSQSVIMNNAITESASWQTQYQISFIVSPIDSGTVTPSGTNTWQNAGAFTISANPNADYKFSSWTNTGFITMDQYSSSVATATINGPGTIIANLAYQPISTPTPTPRPTPIPTQTSPTSTPKPTLTPTPTPTPVSSSTVTAVTSDGTPINLVIRGNVTTSQISNVTIITDKSAFTTRVSFILVGASGSSGLCNLTIPKNAIPYGTIPTIYIDNQNAQSQGYTQDDSNYYVWFTTHFSTHDVSIVFKPTAITATTSLWPLIVLVLAIFIIPIVIIIAKKRKHSAPA